MPETNIDFFEMALVIKHYVQFAFLFVHTVYPGIYLVEANSLDTEAPLLDFDLSITYVIVSSKFYDKLDDFNLNG